MWNGAEWGVSRRIYRTIEQEIVRGLTYSNLVKAYYGTKLESYYYEFVGMANDEKIV